MVITPQQPVVHPHVWFSQHSHGQCKITVIKQCKRFKQRWVSSPWTPKISFGLLCYTHHQTHFSGILPSVRLKVCWLVCSLKPLTFPLWPSPTLNYLFSITVCWCGAALVWYDLFISAHRLFFKCEIFTAALWGSLVKSNVFPLGRTIRCITYVAQDTSSFCLFQDMLTWIQIITGLFELWFIIYYLLLLMLDRPTHEWKPYKQSMAWASTHIFHTSFI